MKLIVGLGNPGEKFQKTRHNTGFLVVDRLTANWQLPAAYNKKFKAEISETNRQGEKIILARPQTYMNESGQSVRALVDFYKLKAKDIIVVHDDKDIMLGKVKTQQGRSDAGHRGIKSIIKYLGTADFTRVRVGVANQHTDRQDTAKFVLKKFGWLEKRKLTQAVELAVQEVEKLLAT